MVREGSTQAQKPGSSAALGAKEDSSHSLLVQFSPTDGGGGGAWAQLESQVK